MSNRIRILLILLFEILVFYRGDSKHIKDLQNVPDHNFEVRQYTFNKIRIKWDESKISSGTISISFCPAEIKKIKCKDIDANANGSPLTIGTDGLEPWTEYDITITHSQNKGRIYKGHIKTFPNSPTEPLGLTYTWVNKDSINVSWIKPRDPNGPLDGYVIMYNNPEVEIESTVTNRVLEDIQKNGKTLVRVSAFNLLDGMRVKGKSANIIVEPQKVTNSAGETDQTTKSTISITSSSEETGQTMKSALLIVGVLGYSVVLVAVTFFVYRSKHKDLIRRCNESCVCLEKLLGEEQSEDDSKKKGDPNKVPYEATWISASDIAVPAGKDENGVFIYVGRGVSDGHACLLKNDPLNLGRYVPYASEECNHSEHEVLIKKSNKVYNWISLEGRSLPRNAILLKKTGSEGGFYIGRVTIEGKVTIRWIDPSNLENNIQDYQILVVE